MATKRTTTKRTAKAFSWRNSLSTKVIAPLVLVAAFAGFGAYQLTTSSADSVGGTLIIDVVPNGIPASEANTIVYLQHPSQQGINAIPPAGSCGGQTYTTAGVALAVSAERRTTCTGMNMQFISPDADRGVKDGAKMFAYASGDKTATFQILKDTTGSFNACDSDGTSPYTAYGCLVNVTKGVLEIQITMTAKPPSDPSDKLAVTPHVTAGTVTGNSVQLNWTKGSPNKKMGSSVISDYNEFYLYMNDGVHSLGGGWSGLKIDDNASSYTMTGLQPCHTYEFALVMQDYVQRYTTNQPVVTTAGCPSQPSSQSKSGSSTSKTSQSSSTSSVQGANLQQNATINQQSNAEGISLDGVASASQHEQAQQHRRNVALTVGLVVFALGLSAIIVTKYLRKRA
jgi:hypothetical protein